MRMHKGIEFASQAAMFWSYVRVFNVLWDVAPGISLMRGDRAADSRTAVGMFTAENNRLIQILDQGSAALLNPHVPNQNASFVVLLKRC